MRALQLIAGSTAHHSSFPVVRQIFYVMTALVLASPSLHADTFTFLDLTDTTTMQTDSTRWTPSSTGCPNVTVPEYCAGHVTVPKDSSKILGLATTNDVSGSKKFYIGEGGGILSDTLEIRVVSFSDTYELLFTSDPDDSVLSPCPTTGCQITETGDIQTAFTIHWSDGTVDTIKFQSDVPEPGAFGLFASILVLLAAGARRRLMNAR